MTISHGAAACQVTFLLVENRWGQPAHCSPSYQGYQPITIGTGPLGSPDRLIVFTGSQQPVALNGQQNGTLTVLDTSVKHLHTSFSAYYIPGTETRSLATSNDGGLTWHKYRQVCFLTYITHYSWQT